MSHDPPPDVINEPVLIDTVPGPIAEDSKIKNDEYDYHCCFMNMALLQHNFADAGREGDLERLVFRCIKFFVLHSFKTVAGQQSTVLKHLTTCFS